MKLNDESFGLNYEFKNIMNSAKINNSEAMRASKEIGKIMINTEKKYANELNGRENSNLKAYCQTYDSQVK